MYSTFQKVEKVTNEPIKSIKGLLESHGKPPREVYLDSENSGMIFPESLEEMIRTYRECDYGHPSITHKPGWQSFELMQKTTSTLLKTLNINDGDIVYTHGGSEANNLAIQGLARATRDGRKKIIYPKIEHLSVKFPAENLQKEGFKVIELPVDKEGFLDQEKLEEAIDEETLMVSVAAVNHEIGTIQDLKRVSEIIKDKDPKVYLHTDACDALCKTRLDLDKMGIDLASFSSHKIYGPKGAGILYARPGLKLDPIVHGQLSTQRLWPGVENVPSIAGFSKALEIMNSNFEGYNLKMKILKEMIIDGIFNNVENVLLNGPMGDRRVVDNANISFLYCEGEALTVELSLKGIYVSSGSACTSRVLEPSHVLLAIGRRHEEAHGSLLMKVTPMHKKEDVEYILSMIKEAVDRIRKISPIGVIG